MGHRRGAYRVLVVKHEGKRPLERPRHRGEDNIKTDLQAVEWVGRAWTGLVWFGIETGAVPFESVMNFGVSYNAGSFMTS
jgi:hypothetical protein